MDNLSSVYLVNQLLHVSGIFVAHHQEDYCIYTKIGTYILIYMSQSGEHFALKIHLRMVHNSFAFRTWISHLQTRSVVHTADMLYVAFHMQVGWSYT